MSRLVILKCFVLVALIGRELKKKKNFQGCWGVGKKSRKRMWQKAIEIGKSTTGDKQQKELGE